MVTSQSVEFPAPVEAGAAPRAEVAVSKADTGDRKDDQGPVSHEHHQGAGPHGQVVPAGPRHNDDVEWAEFEPDAYWEHNYRHLRGDDLQIIQIVSAFFNATFADRDSADLRGIDVGSGSNLYPALGMLPWCREIDLVDHSQANVDWLIEHVEQGRKAELDDSWEWREFWRAYGKGGHGYSNIKDPAALLARVTKNNIRERNIFEIDENRYDMGTMFFVAESMTSYVGEFQAATQKFLNCLRPGSPFAAAFMDSSVGYVVGEKSFPAVKSVTKDVVREYLGRHAFEADINKIDVLEKDPLRKGYDGMIIATGTTKA